MRSAAGDRRHDADFVAVFDRRIEVVEEADVFVGDEDVDETSHGARIVADPLLDAGVAVLEGFDHGADIATVDFDGLVRLLVDADLERLRAGLDRTQSVTDG